MYAPTGMSPLSECSLRMRNSWFARNPLDEVSDTVGLSWSMKPSQVHARVRGDTVIALLTIEREVVREL